MLISQSNLSLLQSLFKSIILIWFLSSSVFVVAQDKRKIDSLMIALKDKNESRDTTTATLYNQLSWEYRSSDFSKAIEYADKGLALSSSLGFQLGISEANSFKGVTFRNMGEYERAMSFFIKSLQVAEKSKLKTNIAYGYNNLGDIYKLQKQFDKAIENTLKALDLFLALKDSRGIGYAYIRLGEIYASQQDYPRALNAFESCLQMRKKDNDKRGVASVLLRLGNVYEQQKQWDKALNYYQEGLSIFEVLKDKRNIASTEADLGKVYLQLNQNEYALQNLEQSLRSAKAMNAKDIVKKTARIISDYYLSIKNYNKAYDYLNDYLNVLDSLNAEETNTKLLSLQKSYELDQKQSQLELAQKQNYNWGIITVISAIAFGIIILILVLFIRANSQKYRLFKVLTLQKREIEIKNKELEQQQLQIEKSNEDVTASVVYAQLIQESILPQRQKIKEYLPNHFILYKPKDIVSGDFYWFSAKNYKLVLAAVDCTGHGVPGAFMSIIANALLNEIVNIRNILSPEKILEELRLGVNRVLRQEETGNQDGMDISICTIDNYPEEFIAEIGPRKLEFAGAGNPLYYIQNNELKEIRGNNIVIGGFHSWQTDKAFVKHTLEISQKTDFYIFSDGYQDQFGGPQGRRFMQRRFKETILKANMKPLEEQKDYLNDVITEWIADNKQIDDILVIGVKL